MADIQQQIADGARPRLARVGDRIEHGQGIPANVVRLTDQDGDPWIRNEDEPGTWRGAWSAAVRAGSHRRYALTDGSLRPFTVVEVDPEPQPADDEPEPVHYRVFDGPMTLCGEDVYQVGWTDEAGIGTCQACRVAADEEPVGARDTDGCLRLKGTATGDNQLDPLPQPATSDPGTFTDCVAWLIDAGLGSNADRRIDRMAAQHQELQARYDTVVSDRETVRGSLEIVKDRVTRPLCQLLGVQHNEEIVPAVTALLPAAESGPLVLTLPQVPPGAVALIGGVTGHRWEPTESGRWAAAETGQVKPWVKLIAWEGSVTVEMAPPREPRTWPKLDEAPEDADLLQGASGTRYGRSHFSEGVPVFHALNDLTGKPEGRAYSFYVLQHLDGPLEEVIQHA